MQCGMRLVFLLTAIATLVLTSPADACDSLVATACVDQDLGADQVQIFGSVLVVDVALSLHDLNTSGRSAGYGGLELLLAGPQLGIATHKTIELARDGSTAPALLTGVYAAWMGVLTFNGVRSILQADGAPQEPSRFRDGGTELSFAPTATPAGGPGMAVTGTF